MKTLMTAATLLATVLLASAASAEVTPAQSDILVNRPALELIEGGSFEVAGYYYVPTCFWETYWGPYGSITQWVCY